MNEGMKPHAGATSILFISQYFLIGRLLDMRVVLPVCGQWRLIVRDASVTQCDLLQAHYFASVFKMS
jgi:hypothetical protein